MTDTPIAPETWPRPSRLDAIKSFVGDLARPFAIIVTSASAAISGVVIACKVSSFEGAAIFIGAIYGGVGVLFGAKAWENAKTGGQAAQVEIAKATTSGAGQ